MAETDISPLRLAMAFFFEKDLTRGLSVVLKELSVGDVESDETVLRERLAMARRWLRTNTLVYKDIDDTLLPKTPATPSLVVHGDVTILDVAAFIGRPDDAEFLLFGFTRVSGKPEERRSARVIYADMFADAHMDGSLSSDLLTTQEMATGTTEISVELQSVHADIARESQTAMATLAERMRTDARGKKVLPRTPNEVPSTLWRGAYANSAGVEWESPEDKFAIKEVYDKFMELYHRQTLGGTKGTEFDAVYNALPNDSFRAVLALTTWLVPHTASFHWPDPSRIGFNPWFKEIDNRTLFLKILEEDPMLTGAPLRKTIQFP